jgi:hypothetical protein
VISRILLSKSLATYHADLLSRTSLYGTNDIARIECVQNQLGVFKMSWSKKIDRRLREASPCFASWASEIYEWLRAPLHSVLPLPTSRKGGIGRAMSLVRWISSRNK